MGRPLYAVYDWFVENRPRVDWRVLETLNRYA